MSKLENYQAVVAAQRAIIDKQLQAGEPEGILQAFDSATSAGADIAKDFDDTQPELEQLRTQVTANKGRNLPKDVEADYQRRVAMGLRPEDAMIAATRQARHNKELADETTEIAKALNPKPKK